MPVLSFRALDARGRVHEDEILAESTAAAREMLRKKGLYPVEIRDKRPPRGAMSTIFSGLRFNRLPLSELVSLTRRLACLLGAGIQVVPAFSSLIRQCRSEFTRRILTRIREEVNEGATLARALGTQPGIFSPMYVSLVRAGENSGALGPILSRLAGYMELQHHIRRRMAGALAYPILMMVTGFGVLFFMMIYVVPNVVQIFRQAKRDLPLPTRILVRVSDFLVAYDLLLLTAAGALGVGFLFWRRTGAARKVLDAWKFRLPLLGDLVHKRAIARFARTLGLLLAAGLPILDALAVAKHVMANTVMEEAAEAAREATRKGGRFSAALESGGVFPPLLVDMAAAGEDTGTLDVMLEHVAQQFEQETEASIQAMLSLVEPVLILTMGAAVGFVVIAILLPLFEISQLVR